MRKRYETRVEKIAALRKGIATVFADRCSNGFKIPPAEETLWGALNAVTASVDHIQKIEGDRYAYMLFGNGAALKEKAYELALAQLPKNCRRQHWSALDYGWCFMRESLGFPGRVLVPQCNLVSSDRTNTGLPFQDSA